MTHKERVQTYFTLLLSSPSFMKAKIEDDEELKQDVKKRVQDFATACFDVALEIDARFEKMNLEE
jgi:hypothetical protein